MRIRAFLGVQLSMPVTRRIAEEVERRRAAVAEAGARAAWVPPASLHLTLKFLGSTPEESLDAVKGRLARVAQGHAPFEARVRGLGAFPSVERPRILWMGAEPHAALTKLARDVDDAMVELGYAKEERDFHPHVTLARVLGPGAQRGAGCDGGGSLASVWTGEADAGASMLSEIIIYESKTLSKGAEYVARARVPLGKVLQASRAERGE